MVQKMSPKKNKSMQNFDPNLQNSSLAIGKTQILKSAPPPKKNKWIPKMLKKWDKNSTKNWLKSAPVLKIIGLRGAGNDGKVG